MQSLAEELMHTTVRLEGSASKGSSVGTGFLFFHEDRLFLVTNKHVVEDVRTGQFVMLRGEVKNNEKHPILGKGVSLPFNQKNFIGHPDPNIDVAAMNVSSIFSEVEKAGDIMFWKHITEKEFPTQEHYEKFIGPIEDIIFIGYPNGIWDSKNILPISRRGMTATPCYYDFNGEKKFLVDASVFPGSSGSPVFAYYSGSHPDKSGNLNIGNRMHFLGIIAKVYLRLEQGDIKVADIPTAQKAFAEINQMIDLGIVFKAETVKECVEHYLHVVTTSNK